MTHMTSMWHRKLPFLNSGFQGIPAYLLQYLARIYHISQYLLPIASAHRGMIHRGGHYPSLRVDVV